MKSLIRLSLLAVFLATGNVAEGQVMISQYIETNSGSTPKGIEVYNHTSTPIDFSVQNLTIYKGASGGPCSIIPGATVSSGILGPYEVWVIGTPDLTAEASLGNNIAGVKSHSFVFNGDDALELYLGGTLMDVFGTCGTDPGSSWNANSVSTKDENIAVKTGICSGTTTPWTDPSIRFDNISDGSTMTGFGDAPGCNPNSITTTFTPTSITVECDTEYSNTISFTSTGTYNSGNEFIVEISDPNGSFLNASILDSLTMSGVGPSSTINFTVPANFYAGTNYRIRVISDSPATTGSNNGNDIEIVNSSPCLPTIPSFGGVIINEFSNGPSGSKEYYELLVVGECGETADIRGYIIDDNNGDFRAEGVSGGHFKFSNDSQWSNIDVGSLIIVYNNSAGGRNDKIPLDDLNDTNSDAVYIIPHNNTSYLSGFDDLPNATDNSYSPSSSASSVWLLVSLANDADAVQTRKPNGDYFFGISYGVGTNGGTDNTKLINSKMEQKVAYFNAGDFRNINNWSIGDATADLSTTKETPGEANNPDNQGWIDDLSSSTGNCGLVALPISIVKFEGEYINRKVELHWKSKTELNNAYYELLHSKTGYNFKSIAKVDGHGTVNSPKEYTFTHNESRSGTHYYRLNSADYDGEKYNNGTISIQIKRDKIFYDIFTQTLHFAEKGVYHIFSTSGKKVLEVNNQANIPFSKKGLYLIYNQQSGMVTKVIIP